MNPNDHERCSELLLGYTQGRLGAAEHGWVEGHLATCSDCRAEQAALATLAAGEVAPLTEIERVRLHRGVRTASPSTPVTSVIPARAPGRGGRFLQVLGTAALLVMIGGFMYTSGLVGGGSDLDDGSGQGGGGDSFEAPAPASQDGAESQADQGATTESGAAASKARSAPQPTFRRSLGNVTGSRLNKLGREGLPLVVFSRAYGVEQVPDLQSEFRDQLAAAAGPHEEALRECSDLVTEAFANALPAYGALATLERLDGEDVLVLAFAWTDQSKGPLDQSMVWAWPLGDCAQPVEYFKNVIQPKG